MNELQGYNFTMIAKSKDIIYAPTIDKLKFYRQFFGDLYNQPKPKDENVVYLLLNLTRDISK
jgi:predicted signal transduction protein with EAL and GGDEF domain